MILSRSIRDDNDNDDDDHDNGNNNKSDGIFYVFP
jgi:hypothetical protein